VAPMDSMMAECIFALDSKANRLCAQDSGPDRGPGGGGSLARERFQPLSATGGSKGRPCPAVPARPGHVERAPLPVELGSSRGSLSGVPEEVLRL